MMSYQVKIIWKKQASEAFIDNKYSRAHRWLFDGGIEVAASSSPHVVPLPMSIESAVDPEEAFIASLSSCHMLWFLSLAAAKKYIIETYEDNATGILAKNAEGKLAMTEVTINPSVRFIGEDIPSQEQIEMLHHFAHEKCYIANSVTTKVNIVSQQSKV